MCAAIGRVGGVSRVASAGSSGLPSRERSVGHTAVAVGVASNGAGQASSTTRFAERGSGVKVVLVAARSAVASSVQASGTASGASVAGVVSVQLVAR